MPNSDNTLKSQQSYGVSWGVERRLEFIEFRLFWEERINRGDLISFFNISVPQASADFSKYQELAPGNMIYNNKGKFYFASPNFNPILNQPSAEQYLVRYMAETSGMLQRHKSFLGFVPTAGTVPLPWRRVEPSILRDVLRAIRKKKAVAVEYQSLSRPERLTRWISPHALGFDGNRWHCRAYCHIDDRFKDFVLGRILNISSERDSKIEPTNDTEWESFIEVKIGPHSQWSEGQKEIIEHEYGMTNGEVSIPVRRAMLYYLISRLGLMPGHNKTLQKQQTVLLNEGEIQEALGPEIWPSPQT